MSSSRILKVDLDIENGVEALKQLSIRLRYLHYNKVLNYSNIKSIFTVYKSKYSVKIYLREPISPDHIIIIQLILGSDWRKEVYSFKDYHINGLHYWNRMFDVKRYPDGKYLNAITENITKVMDLLIKKSSKEFEEFFEQINIIERILNKR